MLLVLFNYHSFTICSKKNHRAVNFELTMLARMLIALEDSMSPPSKPKAFSQG